MNNYLFFLINAAIVITPTALVVWYRYRRHTLLRQWEARQPYAWVEYQWGPYYKEPSLRDVFSRETFYQITAYNRKGRIRRGWLRCGSWWLGSFTNRIQVSLEPYEKQPNRAQMAKRAGGSTSFSKKEC